MKVGLTSALRKNKTLLLIASVLLIILVDSILVGWYLHQKKSTNVSPTPATVEWKTYSDTVTDISFLYPDSPQFAVRTDFKEFSKAIEIDYLSQPMILISENQPGSVLEYLKSITTINHQGQSFQGGEISGPTATFNGHDAYIAYGELTIPDVKITDYDIIGENHDYTITLCYPSNKPQFYDDYMKRISESISWERDSSGGQ